MAHAALPTQPAARIGARFQVGTEWWTVYAFDRNTFWAYREGHPGEVSDFTEGEVIDNAAP